MSPLSSTQTPSVQHISSTSGPHLFSPKNPWVPHQKPLSSKPLSVEHQKALSSTQKVMCFLMVHKLWSKTYSKSNFITVEKFWIFGKSEILTWPDFWGGTGVALLCWTDVLNWGGVELSETRGFRYILTL